MFFQLSLKALYQGKTISSATCKPGDDVVFIKSSDFSRVGFHDGIPHSHLAVAADDNGVTFSNRNNGCAFELIQWVFSRVWDSGVLGHLKGKMGYSPLIFKALFSV